MKSFTTPMRGALAVFLSAGAAHAALAEVTAPPKEKLCQACHGAKGANPILPQYPKINGQNEAYLISSLQAYRAGQRTGGLATAMTAQAARLTDDEIAKLAAYYAAQ